MTSAAKTVKATNGTRVLSLDQMAQAWSKLPRAEQQAILQASWPEKHHASVMAIMQAKAPKGLKSCLKNADAPRDTQKHFVRFSANVTCRFFEKRDDGVTWRPVTRSRRHASRNTPAASKLRSALQEKSAKVDGKAVASRVASAVRLLTRHGGPTPMSSAPVDHLYQ